MHEAVEGMVGVGVGVALNVAYGNLQARRDHNALEGPPSTRRHFALTHKDTLAMMCCLNQGDLLDQEANHSVFPKLKERKKNLPICFMELCYDAEIRLHHSPFLSCLFFFYDIIDHISFSRDCFQILKISQCSFM